MICGVKYIGSYQFWLILADAHLCKLNDIATSVTDYPLTKVYDIVR